MRNISFLACTTEGELWDLTVCIVVNGEKFQSHHYLDLGPTMPTIELVRVIFIYYYLNFNFLDQFLFELSCKTHTETHTDSDEYSIVAFAKTQL